MIISFDIADFNCNAYIMRKQLHLRYYDEKYLSKMIDTVLKMKIDDPLKDSIKTFKYCY